MGDTNTKKAQASYKKNYDKQVRFKPRFAAGDYIFVERTPLMASAADCGAYKRYSRLLLCHTGSY